MGKNNVDDPDIVTIDSNDWMKLTADVDCAVRHALNNGAKLEMLFGVLIEKSISNANKKIKPLFNPLCGYAYNSKSLEYIIWMNALLSMAWTCETFRRKSRDGHCRTHSKPCLIGREDHTHLQAEAIRSFETLLKQLKEIPMEMPDSG